MSSKINILEIVSGHFRTLKDTEGKTSKIDIVVFIVLPVIIGLLSASLSFNLNKDLSSLLVNFGSIFTALLLSVLVLVYEQESKLENKENKDDINYVTKKRLLRELYYNISFSIVCSLSLVLFCFIHSIILNLVWNLSIGSYTLCIKFDVFFITPIVVVISINLFLNILMIVKRMHALLISQ